MKREDECRCGGILDDPAGLPAGGVVECPSCGQVWHLPTDGTEVRLVLGPKWRRTRLGLSECCCGAALGVVDTPPAGGAIKCSACGRRWWTFGEWRMLLHSPRK